MRKLLILLAIILITISNSFAQDIVLSPDAKNEFNSQKMSVELTQVGLNSGFIKSMFSQKYATGWQAYNGYKKISEEEFLTITGHIKEAEFVKAHEFNNSNNLIGSFLLTGLGAGIFVIADKQNNGDVLPIKIAGAGLSFFGFQLMVKAKINMSLNYVPSSTATSMADDYNHQLMLNISKNF